MILWLNDSRPKPDIDIAAGFTQSIGPMSALKPYLIRASGGNALTGEEMTAAMNILLAGEANDAEIAGFFMALRTRGETVEEISAAAAVMRELALKVDAPDDAIDTCGTGGDGADTFNISTAVALIVAGCGVPVAKHGNKAASSRSGSSDVLSALGVRLDLAPADISRCITKANVGFMFAALHHATVANVAPVRTALGVRTIFNVLGPLANPAGAKRQLMGVFDKELVTPIAEVMSRLGVERAWVVHGADGLDELSTTGPSFVAQLSGGKVTEFTVTPEEAGLPVAAMADLKGGAPEENAAAIERLLDGECSAFRDIAVMNAAGALIVAEKAATLKEAAALAQAAIDNGAAKKALTDLVRISQAAP